MRRRRAPFRRARERPARAGACAIPAAITGQRDEVRHPHVERPVSAGKRSFGPDRLRSHAASMITRRPASGPRRSRSTRASRRPPTAADAAIAGAVAASRAPTRRRRARLANQTAVVGCRERPQLAIERRASAIQRRSRNAPTASRPERERQLTRMETTTRACWRPFCDRMPQRQRVPPARTAAHW